jgi:predicted nucleic acid-binding Zn ribbon protein
MALAQASLIGDIDLGGINNKGVSGEDIAAIFGAQAQAEAIQSAREREEKRQRTKVFLISGSVVSALILVLVLFYYSTKSK